MKFKTLKGIEDITPPETSKWQQVETIAREVFRAYGCKEIKLPIIEPTELFRRSIGETTEIVEKEMYTFQDKGGRSVTLRPEGTAGFVRAFVKHHLYNEPSPQKYYYMGPMFRYERPQAGRQRQFYQVGVEVLGTEDPRIDAEVISMLRAFFERLRIKDVEFEVTSIGCRRCRPDYKEALKYSLKDKLTFFCDDCKRRYNLNPLRILDCKVGSCIEMRKDSPSITGFLCKDCRGHFDNVQYYLRLLNLPYTINPQVVRGLDYYTRTAFEIKSTLLGAQNAVAAGGRYGNLVEEFGGPPTSGIGFAVGVERLIRLIKESHAPEDRPDLFFCSLGKKAGELSLILAEELRAQGLWVEINYDKPTLRSQMRRADRIRAKYVIVIGEDEIKEQMVIIKDMEEGREFRVPLKGKEILNAIRQCQ